MPSLIVTRKGTILQSMLTCREREILEMVGQGLKQKQIAERLFISSETVKKHLQNGYRKLGAHNKVDALRKAGLI